MRILDLGAGTGAWSAAFTWYGGGPLIADHRPVPFEHLTDEFLPLLARFGVAAETIDRILVATPRRLLAGEPS
jgi:predicted metal-dependent phosphotriesterase family hydrolase